MGGGGIQHGVRGRREGPAGILGLPKEAMSFQGALPNLSESANPELLRN